MSSPNSTRPKNLPAGTVTVSVLMPGYNESEVIRETYRRVRAACVSTGLPFELVFVNDGSKDNTWHRLGEISRADPCVSR